jgi:hypothetical protein
MYRVVGKEARIREGTKKEKTVSEEVGGLAIGSILCDASLGLPFVTAAD